MCMLQFVDMESYKKAIKNPERAFLLYVDDKNNISLQADIELGGDPVNYRVELMDFDLEPKKPILLTTVECRGFNCGGIKFIEYDTENEDTTELAIKDFLRLSDEATFLICENMDLCKIIKSTNNRYCFVYVLPNKRVFSYK